MRSLDAMRPSRRRFLSSTAVALTLGSAGAALSETIAGSPLWKVFQASPPSTLAAGRWYFFTPDEVRAVGAIAERLIPGDALSVSGKEAGCVEFIDRQLAGPYGSFEQLYMKGPFHAGTPQQGDQFPLDPRQRYRLGLAGLQAHCSATYRKAFADLPPEQRDQVLTQLQKGEIALRDVDARAFFAVILQNTMEGFFADPIYGGNKDMVSWRMIGFPGARYDYRDYIDRHNQTLDLPPLSIAGRSDWRVKE